MPLPMCRGCANRLSACNAGVDIFSQETSSGLPEDNDIRTGIELITGLAVSDKDGLPGRLCDECKNKLKEFLAFRTQLLTSLRIFLSPGYASGKSEQSSEARSQVASSLPPLVAVQVDSNDESSTEINEEENIEPVVNDQENKYTDEVGYNHTECSKELNKIHVIEEDVESDIDVCSGEDYDVLELDVQSKKDEIYEIESSGESDIQVCDYEPSGL